MEPVANFALGFLKQGYGASAYVFELRSGDAARFPDPAVVGPYDVTVYNSSDYADAALDPEVEIDRITAVDYDADTITLAHAGSNRTAQQGTAASRKDREGRTYAVVLAWTKRNVDEIHAAIEDRYTKAEVDTMIEDLDLDTYSKEEMDGFLAAKVDTEYLEENYYSISQIGGLLAAKQDALGYVPQDLAARVTSLTGADDAHYPTAKAVKDYADAGLATKQASLGYAPVDRAGDTMTGKLKMSLVSGGIELYNTVDQTTNYERFSGAWVSGIYTLQTSKGGTGTTLRDINILGGNVGISDIAFTPQRRFHLHLEQNVANYFAVTNLNTGKSAADGTLIGVEQDGTAAFRQRENLGLRHYTNDILRHEFLAGGAGIYYQNALAVTDAEALTLSNITAATVGVPVQISPGLKWSGSALRTSDNVSRLVEWLATTLPQSASAEAVGLWRLRRSVAGGAYSSMVVVADTGSLIANSISTGAGAFSAGDYYIGSSRMLFTASNNLNLTSAAGRDLLLGTGTVTGVLTLQSALGNIVYAPGALTGAVATSAVSIAQAWNTSGAPDLISANVTLTAADVLSNLINLKVNTLSKFSVTRRAVMTLADDTINPSFSISGVSGNTMRFAADSSGGYVGSVNLIPFRIMIQNGVLYPAVFGTNGDVGLGGNVTNNTTMAGAQVAIKSGYLGVGTNTPSYDIHAKKAAASSITAESTLNTAYAQVFALNNASKYIANVVYGSTYPGTLYGLTAANLAAMTSNGSAVVYGAEANVNAYMITNAITRTQWDNAGNMIQLTGDIEAAIAAKGIVLKDRGDSSRRRILVTNGVLSTEAA